MIIHELQDSRWAIIYTRLLGVLPTTTLEQEINSYILNNIATLFADKVNVNFYINLLVKCEDFYFLTYCVSNLAVCAIAHISLCRICTMSYTVASTVVIVPCYTSSSRVIAALRGSDIFTILIVSTVNRSSTLLLLLSLASSSTRSRLISKVAS